MRFDCIVLGGGTAGSILAARLSEDRNRSVLLLEAGPDYPDDVPGELLDGSAPVTSGHNWEMEALLGGDGPSVSGDRQARIARVFQRASQYLGTGSPGAPAVDPEGLGARFQYPMAKVMGGGSAINGALAFHARPQDYARWTAAGNDRWSWDGVLPFVNRVERADGEKPALPMETTAREELTRLQEAFFAACLEAGHAAVDLRQGTAGGVGTIPKNLSRGRRVSTAHLYLEAARKRPNLAIVPGCLADRILFAARSGVWDATGVDAIVDGRRQRFAGGHVVLCAGTINSPAILLRSGIGAAAEVARAGGRPILDLPGVGKNLIDHPAVTLWAVPRPGACRAGEPVHQVMLQEKTDASAVLCDVQSFMLSALPTKKLPPLQDVVGADLAIGISVIVATPRSRGHIEVLDGDPARCPRIHLRCAREESDLHRLKAGLRAAWRLLHGERIFPHVERVVAWNRQVIDSDPLMERMIRATVRGAWHPVGTLRMGGSGDPMAVVDQHGRLFGCSNVTVADGSIMPELPSVPTNLTCMLIAERMADCLRGMENG